MKDEIKVDLEDFIDALGTIIGYAILFGIGITFLLGFIKLAIWIWSF